MNKDNSHNDLDNFLKESFEEHTITPAPELWDKIEQRFQPKVVPILKYTRLKVVLYVSAAIITGLVFIIFFPKKETAEVTQKTESTYSEPVTESKSEPQSESSGLTTEDIETPKIPIENTKIKINSSDNVPELTEESGPIEIVSNESATKEIYQNQLEKLSPVTLNIQEKQYENDLILVEDNSEKITAVKNNKESTGKKNKTNKRDKPARNKRSSPRKYSGKSRYDGNYSKSGLILEDFTLKLNATPTVTQLFTSDKDLEPNYESLNINDPGFTINAGVEMEYRINKNWSIYSGVKTYVFNQSFEEYSYEISSPIQENQIFKSDAGIYLINGEYTGNIPGSVKLDANMKLRYLEIPLIGRYHINNYYIDGGINYSYLLSNKSSIIQNDYPSELIFERHGGFKKHTFGLAVGVGYDKTFNSGFRFEVGPEIKFTLNNLYKDIDVTGVPMFVGIRVAFCVGRYYPE